MITPEARLSYPALFEPRETPSGESKFSCVLIFDKTADLSELRKEALAVLEARWGNKAAAMVKAGQLRLPFRDGAEKDAIGYGPGTVFMNISSKARPGVVDRFPDATGRPRPITDPAEIYPGCYVRVSVRAFAYDQSGNRGASFALNNLQKLRDGTRLDGRLRAEDEFEALEEAPADFDTDARDDAADLDDLLS